MSQFKTEFYDFSQQDLPYKAQLEQLDPALGQFVLNNDPNGQDRQEAEDLWQQQNIQIGIDTAQLKKHAISNLEALPFRTMLENAGMPFEDNVIYTSQDIADANSDEEVLYNTLANFYQLGSLINAMFVELPFNKKFSQQDLDQFSDATQKFINDLTVSSNPFEYINYPLAELDEAFNLLTTVAKVNPTSLMTNMVLHPFTNGLPIVFILADNIDGMSPKQISQQINNLSNLQAMVKRINIQDVINSPETERNQDKSSGMGRDSGSVSRSERVKMHKIRKLSSTKKITQVINRAIRKQSSTYHTQNITKTMHKTYNKPNRREPENDFKPGKSTKKIYRPDIHLYLDTSGSMSVDSYKKGILAAIDIAKDLKSNIYISSYSDILAEPILLDGIAKQSAAVLLQKALKIPVVDGGTDFENVYNNIQNRAKAAMKMHRLPEYPIIFSDMEYWFSSGYQIPKYSQKTLHLMVDSYDGGETFKTEAYNAGITHIDQLLYEI